MSLVDTRNNSAMFKRAEQLRRWEESDTNRQSDFGRNLEDRKIRFSSGCVFLAACMAGDKEEVLRLLDTGADIDTANVDGLTALHQACIDDNLDMVEFLVQHSADINRADNEGWTPLHATASCGFVSIARYLIENGAELDLVNSDGELPIDLSASNSMENLLQQYIDERNIDCDEARQKEEKMMLNDAKKWLRSDASEADRRHPRTGATALHVAAAKGYAKVLSLLLAGRANVDQQDNDGWTPLHAAAHWGQKEAAQMLVTSLADMDIKNYAGQTAIDVADPDVVRFLEDMKKKKNKRRPGSQLRISDSLDINRDIPPKVIRVEAKPEPKDEEKPKPPTSEPSGPNENAQEEESNSWRRSARNSHQDKTQEKDNQITSDSDVILRRTHSFETDEKFYQKLQELRARIKSNSCPKIPATTTTTASTTTTANATTVSVESNSGGDVVGPNNNGLVTNSKLNNNSSNQINCVQRSASLKDHRAFRPNAASPPPLSSQQQQQQQQSPAPDQVRRSFVPPVRDEESETQRKAHAKRVRETRRSTQGVTLDEIKSAEELVKKKNLSNSENAFKLEDVVDPVTSSSANQNQQPQPSTTASSVQAATNSSVLRRPTSLNSANLTVSSSSSSPLTSPSSTVAGITTTLRPVSAPFLHHQPSPTENHVGDNGSRLKADNCYDNGNGRLEKPGEAGDDKDYDKENDSRGGTGVQATQAVIQRRRRPKRRSTGVVHVDIDDLEGDRDSPADADDKESGAEESRKSRLSSVSTNQSEGGDYLSPSDAKSRDSNGEFIDYKALYEAQKAENDKLKEQMKNKDEALSNTKAALERFTNATTKNTLSDLEKRERRAMERKMSEMEEELKQLDTLKQENQRLKDENGALIRVISKLSK